MLGVADWILEWPLRLEYGAGFWVGAWLWPDVTSATPPGPYEVLSESVCFLHGIKD